MNKPEAEPEYVSYWQITCFVGLKIIQFPNPEVNSTGMYETKLAAEHALLLLTLQNPGNKYFIHEISYPFNEVTGRIYK